ncbi:Beta-galactosidase [Cytospora mali]|uniref:Beta-galactosidase n=1 Tax=Cytospora mali TaxID=578113 RepID=A0A194VQ14_CYTMA|nr:Beta-galactosidase [Valsa mali]
MCNPVFQTLWLLIAIAKYSLATSTASFGNTTIIPERGGHNTSTVASTVPYKLQVPPLDTPWTHQVGLNPWPEHPRPQLKRDRWLSLNGIWTYQSAGDATSVTEADIPTSPLKYETLIPSCIESAISGLQVLNTTAMWFATTFEIPLSWDDQNVLLNFEAVDYESTVFINGILAGFHRGGYSRNTIDVTDLVQMGGTNEVKVFVFDPTDEPGYVIPIGKQTKKPDHIFYRPCSGIWQTVWLESAPAIHISQLDVKAGADGSVVVNVHSSNNSTGLPVIITVDDQDSGSTVVQTGISGTLFTFTVPFAQAWSPDSPILYNLSVAMADDEVTSYTGFRTVGRGDVGGVERPLLNGEFVFQFATLDQGFWPDGIYLAPTYEAMVFDLKVLKDLGFNTIRKHIKFEPDLFYYACDKIGLMIIQDMPSMSPRVPLPNDAQQAEFERQLEVLVNEHLSYPSVVTWVIYNEGWGQILTPPYPEFAIADRIRRIDGTRLIDATSGWHDHGAGDFSDNHHYASPQCGTPFYSVQSTPYDDTRVGIQGEFGGIGMNASIEHLWNVQEAIDMVNLTYEINVNLQSFNYRAHDLLSEYREQIELFDCSAGVWTQTTDVEGEVNGLLTYDRRVMRADVVQWQDDIQSLYDTAAGRGGYGGLKKSTERL